MKKHLRTATAAFSVLALALVGCDDAAEDDGGLDEGVEDTEGELDDGLEEEGGDAELEEDEEL